MPIQAFVFELKSLTEAGQFRGMASTYGNTDMVGDVCMPGCFTRTLQDGKNRPLLFQHRDPIGVVTLTDSPEGLIADGVLTMAVQQAKDAYELTRAGAVRGLSIGFQTIKEQYVGDVRQLLEVKLYEVSLTPIPCNELATVGSVKSAQQDRAIREALQLFRKDVLSALR